MVLSPLWRCDLHGGVAFVAVCPSCRCSLGGGVAFVALWPWWQCGLVWRCDLGEDYLRASNCCGVCLKLVTSVEFTGKPLIKLWTSPQACTGLVTTLKGPLVD
jgi:hypothetical protein